MLNRMLNNYGNIRKIQKILLPQNGPGLLNYNSGENIHGNLTEEGGEQNPRRDKGSYNEPL